MRICRNKVTILQNENMQSKQNDSLQTAPLVKQKGYV